MQIARHPQGKPQLAGWVMAHGWAPITGATKPPMGMCCFAHPTGYMAF